MTTETEIKSKAAVFRWLEDNGWEISRSQFYDHCRDGLLRKKKGGKVYTLVAVKKYAKLNCKEAKTGEKNLDKITRIQEEMKEVALATAREKLKEREYANRVKFGRVITMEEHETAVVGRAVAFMAQLSHMVQKNVPIWIAMVGGDKNQAPALMEAMLEEIAVRMNAFAAADTDFEVILEADV